MFLLRKNIAPGVLTSLEDYMYRLILLGILACLAFRDMKTEKPGPELKPLVRWEGTEIRATSRSLHRCLNQREFDDLWAKLGPFADTSYGESWKVDFDKL